MKEWINEAKIYNRRKLKNSIKKEKRKKKWKGVESISCQGRSRQQWEDNFLMIRKIEKYQINLTEMNEWNIL